MFRLHRKLEEWKCWNIYLTPTEFEYSSPTSKSDGHQPQSLPKRPPLNQLKIPKTQQEK